MSNPSRKQPWFLALPFAIATTLIILTLFFYWFGLADRYLVFLYNHDMGSRVGDTSPSSAVTSSRYWMAGLVVAGLVMILYVSANWILGRLSTQFKSPEWWRVWSLSAPFLLVAIPVITMTTNQPSLPARFAAQSTLAVIIALALALIPGKMAANQPGDLIWLASDGFGLMLILLTLPGIEEMSQWQSRGQTGYLSMMVTGVVGGLVWLLVMTALRYWRRRPVPTVLELMLAGLAVSYLILPLIHYLAFTDGYYYITNSANFFAGSLILHSSIWLVAAFVSVMITRLRNRLLRSTLEPAAINGKTV
jgi:hypothetical protein